MGVCPRLQRLLCEEYARYRIMAHPEAFTASGVAAASHVPGREMAKDVALQDEQGEFVLLVIPAPTRVHLDAAAQATGRLGLRLASEQQVRGLFPDCQLGAMPPFGGLYGLSTYVDQCFHGSPEIVFQAGSHREVVVMDYVDYERLAGPIVGKLCLHWIPERVAV